MTARSPPRSILRRLAPTAAALALGVVLAEVTLQLAFLAAPELIDAGGPVPVGFEDAELQLRPNPEHPEHDARGFRNAHALDVADVVALGDSQTYGSGVEREASWPQRLGQRSGLAVYNMAFPGWGPAHGLLLVDEALALRPRVLVQSVYAGNDLYDAFQLVYVSRRLPQLATRDARVRRLLDEAEADRPLQAAARERAGADTGERRGRLLRASRLYGLARALRRELRLRLEDADAAWRRNRDLCQRDAPKCEPFGAAGLRTLFTPERRLLALDVADPRIAEGERVVLAALVELRARAAAAGVGLLVVGIPTKELAFRERVEAAGDPSPAYARLVALEAAFWARVRTALDAAGIAFVDAGAVMARQLAAGRAPYRPSRDGHPNELGHDALAERVGAALDGPVLPGRGALALRHDPASP